MERSFFEHSDLRAEYASLLKAGFELLLPAHREQILAWIEAGPDFSWEPDEELARVWRASYERDWLAIIEAHLDDGRRHRLAMLKDAHGEPRMLGQNELAFTSWTGPSSPIEEAELTGQTVEQVVEFLQSWTPTRSPRSPSREGLARSLTDAVAKDPERFASGAESFVGLDPTYVRGLLIGLDNALREERTFGWSGVLRLAAWVVEQPTGPDDVEGTGSLDGDDDFSPNRKALMSLFSRGLALRGGKGAPASEDRERVWAIIERVCQDPNPTPEYEARWGGDNMDPPMLALNTVRPVAIATAIEYGFWVNHHANGCKQPIGMDAVPELRILVERALDPARDPSPAVRAAVGYQLGQLVWFDREWVRSSQARLFPQDEQLLPLRLAIFDTFLRFGWKTAEVALTIPEEYAAAMLRVGIEREGGERRKDPDHDFVDHLMTLYWQGVIPLHGEPPLMYALFSAARAELRDRALHFVGWSLHHTEKPVASEPLERLRALWDWRAAALYERISNNPTDIARGELAEFGWWFASRAFEPDWALPRLQAVLRQLGTVEWDHDVAEYLAELVDQRTREVIDTLALFDPAGGRNGGLSGNVQYWMEHARTILRRARVDEDAAIRASATELIHRWVAHGHIGLRDLLD